MTAGYIIQKIRLRESLKATGLWLRFVRDRERLKSQGVDAGEAWRKLMPGYIRLLNATFEAQDPPAAGP